MYNDSKEIKNRSEMEIKKINNKAYEPCYRTTNQLVFNWKGNAVLCCNDFYEKFNFGNAKGDSIKEIWFNKELKEMRKTLSENGGRQKYDFCKNCDV